MYLRASEYLRMLFFTFIAVKSCSQVTNQWRNTSSYNRRSHKSRQNLHGKRGKSLSCGNNSTPARLIWMNRWNKARRTWKIWQEQGRSWVSCRYISGDRCAANWLEWLDIWTCIDKGEGSEQRESLGELYAIARNKCRDKAGNTEMWKKEATWGKIWLRDELR